MVSLDCSVLYVKSKGNNLSQIRFNQYDLRLTTRKLREGAQAKGISISTELISYRQIVIVQQMKMKMIFSFAIFDVYLKASRL
jgi:hypothetical protein